MPIVVIDPGHGGDRRVGGSSPNNATGPNGLREKDITLDIAVRLRDVYGTDYTVHLTRSVDVNLSLTDRASVARNTAASVMVSIHLNAFDGATQGTEVLVHPDWTLGSDRLASCVQNATLEVTGLPDRGVRQQRLGVLSPLRHDPNTAVALAELSFLDVPEEAERLAAVEYRDRLAQALMRGIRLYLSSDDTWGSQRFVPERQPWRTRTYWFLKDALLNDGLDHQ